MVRPVRGVGYAVVIIKKSVNRIVRAGRVTGIDKGRARRIGAGRNRLAWTVVIAGKSRRQIAVLMRQAKFALTLQQRSIDQWQINFLMRCTMLPHTLGAWFGRFVAGLCQ